MYYTDIHSHLLFGVDDGAKTEEEMYALLEALYSEGVRTLCATPHFHPMRYGHTVPRAERAFALLSDYVREKHPDMSLDLGCELGYYADCRAAVDRKECPLLGGKYLLMDFHANASAFQIQYAMEEMLSAGYRVLLAHVERYSALDGREGLSMLMEWESRGARFQVNASAFSRKASFRTKRQVKRLMREELVHAVASDTHDLLMRRPMLAEAEREISDRYGKEVAELLLSHLPSRILAGDVI